MLDINNCFVCTVSTCKYTGVETSFILHRKATSMEDQAQGLLRLHQHDGVGTDVRMQAKPWSHKFRIWKSFTTTARTLLAYLVEKNCGCEPRVKKLQPTCANWAANLDLPVI